MSVRLMSGFTCLDGRECSPGCTGGRRRRRPGDLRPDRRQLSTSLPCWQSAHRCQSSFATAPTPRGKPRTGDTTMGTGPVPVGRGMGHRLVLLSVRARMNCLVWWTVLRDQLAGVLVTPGGGGEVNAAGRFPGLEWRVQRSCATSADTSATVAVPATVVVAANARSRPSPRLRSLPGTSAGALEATRCRSTRGFPARGRRARKAGALP